MKLVWPRSVFLNRGNHEARKINEKYDFETEVIKKYDAAMFELFQDTFCYLPVAAVVGETVLVLHGGLFKNDKVTLKEIREMKYRGQPKSGTKDKELQILEVHHLFHFVSIAYSRGAAFGHISSPSFPPKLSPLALLLL